MGQTDWQIDTLVQTRLDKWQALLICSSVHEISNIAFLPSTHRQTHADGKDTLKNQAQERRQNEVVEGRFISISKDGTLTLWNNNLTLHKVITVIHSENN